MPAKKKRSQRAVDEGATSSKLRKKEPLVISSPSEEGSEVYKKHANSLSEELSKHFPGASVQINPMKPRSKSFECTLVDPKGEEHVIWSGIKLGPPRRLKFPEPSKIAEFASEKLKETAPDP